jgi:hypothetical protein
MPNVRPFAAVLATSLLVILSGCADRPLSVPSSATLMSEGSNKTSFRTQQYGRVYVTDETAKRILYQGDVDSGQMVDVNAVDDRIQIGGRTVTDQVMDDNHQYKIFFEPLSQERVVRYRDVDVPAR